MDKLNKPIKGLGIISGIIGFISFLRCPEVIMALILPFPSGINKVTIWPLIFLFILTPLFVILANIISFREKRIVGRIFSVVLILVLIFPIVAVGQMFLRRYQPQTIVFKPTVINGENLPVYKEIIKYAKGRDDDKNLTFHIAHFVIVGGKPYMLSGNRVELERANAAFSAQEISEMKALCDKLYSINCSRFQRYNDFFVFYKTAYTSKARGPGVLYSLKGVNPNDVDHEIVNECKPFIKIAGDWYTSRHLMLAGPRSDMTASIPESLLDHALLIDGIDPNELRKFD